MQVVGHLLLFSSASYSHQVLYGIDPCINGVSLVGSMSGLVRIPNGGSFRTDLEYPEMVVLR
ncbi:hypothetical protein ABIA33_003884 [Streptacidiphilus sp. MAP12-16]